MCSPTTQQPPLPSPDTSSSAWPSSLTLPRPTEHPASLAGLPPELRLMITEHLPPSSQLSLRLVARDLFAFPPHLLPYPPADYGKTAEVCEQRALRRILQQVRDVGRSRQIRCIVCRQPTKLERFATATPICRWHEGRFRLGDGNPTAQDVWVPVMREFCAHRGAVVPVDDRDDGSVVCDCACASCPHYPVECMVKTTGGRTTPVRAIPDQVVERGCRDDVRADGESHGGGGGDLASVVRLTWLRFGQLLA